MFFFQQWQCPWRAALVGIASLCTMLLAVQLCAQQPNQKEITVIVYNRQFDGQVYSADIRLILRPNFAWTVDDCSIYLSYNPRALNQTGYVGAMLNIDPELANNYTLLQSYLYDQNGNFVPNIVGIELLHNNNAPFTTKSSGSAQLSFRLGTVRWNATSRSGEDDGIFIFYSLPFAPVLQYYDPVTQLGMRFGEGQVHLTGTPSLPVRGVPCSNMFYNAPQSCLENLSPRSTRNPQADNCPRWPDRVGPGAQPAVARFQDDFDPAYCPTGWQAVDFNYADIVPRMEAARCRWERQMDNMAPPNNINAFDWEQTTTGGRFYFTIDAADLSFDPLGGTSIIAVTYDARNPNALSTFVDSSSCGSQEDPASFKGRSEIVFNNTRALLAANPHRRWTTNTGSCNSHECYDFYAIALHELGHYIGLGHDMGNTQTIMFKTTVWPMLTPITECDADNARRLYIPWRVGERPDNTGYCGSITDVEQPQSIPDKTALAVYPSPAYSGSCTVRYALPTAGFVRLSVVDALGTTVYSLAEQHCEQGVHTLVFPTDRLATGIYFVVLHTAAMRTTEKLRIVR